MFVLFGLPAAITIGWHYVSGGSTADLVAALPMALVDIVTEVVGLLGVPIALLVVAALWVRSKLRHR